MNLIKIISIILIIIVIFIVALSYLSPSEEDVSSIKDANLSAVVVDNANSIYSNVKNKIIYGSPDRQLPTKLYFCPEDNCELELINLINSAKKSIDCAVYDITLDAVTDSLVDAYKQEKEVRIVSDYDRSSKQYSKLGTIRSASIPVITNPSENTYMHNKFCVFDNKTVWLGSMNFTLNGNYKNNNNVLVIEDKELAKLYTNKIDLFFSGQFSLELNPEIEIKQVGNLENYFCLEDNCLYHVLRHMDSSKLSVDCMFFSFTSDEVTDLLDTKNINRRFILEKRNISEYSEFERLKDIGVPVITDNNPNSMHNKLCVFDNQIVMTGSMNLSANGTDNNDESLVFVNDSNLAQRYTEYFNKYWVEWS